VGTSSEWSPAYVLRFLAEVTGRCVVPILFVWVFIVRFGLPPHSLPWFGDDARLYFDATSTWISGGDPWQVRSFVGNFFAGPPPCLLLNLPLLPLGRTFAVYFWTLADVAAILGAIRYYRLPWWWVIYPPFLEATLVGSANLALLGLILLGGGGIAALTKPFAIPGMLGENRWRGVVAAGLLGLVTLPLLPWQMFLGEFGTINANLAAQSPNPDGQPLVFMACVTLALLALGRTGLLMATPALWPHAQIHYAVYSLEAIRRSRILAISTSLALAPYGVLLVAYVAVAKRLWASIRRRTLSQVAPGQLENRAEAPRPKLQSPVPPEVRAAAFVRNLDPLIALGKGAKAITRLDWSRAGSLPSIVASLVPRRRYS
jgi:hypothetical protein